MKSRIPTFIIGMFVPMAAIILAFPFYNRIEPFVLGFSFNYFWIFMWLFLTAFCLFIAYRIDPYNDPEVSRKAAESLKEAKAFIEKYESEANLKNTAKGGNK